VPCRFSGMVSGWEGDCGEFGFIYQALMLCAGAVGRLGCLG
jgi:hypothetical protein